MKQRVLIVNADDCNLTPKVTEAILGAHANGIVTSTTVMLNLRVAPDVVREILASKKLGLGLHLNLTFGEPLSKPALVKSLVDKTGRFKRLPDYLKKFPPTGEITEEFRAQFQRFVRLFKRLPTHVDIHHHLHDHLPFFDALAVLARKHGLPIRWSRLFAEPNIKVSCKGLRTTDNFYGNLDPHTYWTDEVLRHLLFTLPEGVSEVMCHPGWVDDELCAISSLTFPREREYQLFSSNELRRYIARLGIKLTHFGWFR
ncbi:MAG: ChbG/HpnK family deacetylase [Candidatus Omnitrophica bacterium]|nr:ChbG/HpnK family deacetylase [Candidatus Omnitrophota bacterium]